MTTVLVVDDQPLVRAGLSMILSAAAGIDVIGECDDGAQALEVVSRIRPDVVLLDMRMPGMDGIETTRLLAGERDDPDDVSAILAVTTFDDENALLAVLRAGAGGFLLKHNAPTDLVTAVRHVAAGEAWIDPSVAGNVIRALGGGPTVLTSAVAAVDSLTRREREILLLVARGCSNAEISEQLGLAAATVKTHVSRILMKGGCRDRAQAVVFAYESGLVRPGA